MNLGEQKDPTSKVVGFGFVIGLHVLIVYALASGLAHQMVEVIKSPLETKIIKEDKPLDDDKPPPPPPPKLVAPPPPYIPPPEISIQQATNTNAITAVQHEVTAPPPPKVEQAVVAPHVPVHVPAGTDPKKYCSRTPEYPSLSKRNSEEGTVTLEFLIGADGSVLDSKIIQSSGHNRLDEAARSSLAANCHFKPATDDGTPAQTWQQMKYVWRLED